jgi:hypothetical protein
VAQSNQPVPAVAVSSTGAHGTDVGESMSECCIKDRNIELGIMGQHADDGIPSKRSPCDFLPKVAVWLVNYDLMRP